jgi:hypothetical protein
VTHQDDGPTEDCGGQVSANGELDEADGAREAGHEVAEIEGAAAPGVLLAVKVRVCFDAHHSGKAQGNLIKVLEHIGHEHQGHQTKGTVSNRPEGKIEDLLGINLPKNDLLFFVHDDDWEWSFLILDVNFFIYFHLHLRQAGWQSRLYFLQ